MKRSVLAVAIATVLALTGCALVWIYVDGADARVMAGKEAKQVLIAKKRIPAGTTGAQIKNGDYVQVVSMPKGSLPDDVLSAIEPNLEDLALSSDVQNRQLILQGAFASPTATNGGLQIPEGKVAVTVPISNNAGTIFLQAGSKVAVYDTFTLLEGHVGTPAGDGLSKDHLYVQATRLLLPSIQVVATGTPGKVTSANGTDAKSSADQVASGSLGGSSKSDSSTSSTSVDTLVTFAASQDEAERLIHATQTGTLYVALLDDSSKLTPGPGVDNYSLFN